MPSTAQATTEPGPPDRRGRAAPTGRRPAPARWTSSRTRRSRLSSRTGSSRRATRAGRRCDRPRTSARRRRGARARVARRPRRPCYATDEDHRDGVLLGHPQQTPAARAPARRRPARSAQLREAPPGRLLRVAKEHAITVMLVGHVTKDGAVAGPRVLEHLVDAVLLFEATVPATCPGLRSVKQPVRLAGRDRRLRDDVHGPSPRSPTRPRCSAGATSGARSVVACAVEGTPAPAARGAGPGGAERAAMPRRLATGVDRNRLAMILAVPAAARRAARSARPDVFVNVAGGVAPVHEPAADLAIALAIASAQRGMPTGPLVAFGEIGLTGRLRAVPQSPSGACARRSGSASRTRSRPAGRSASPAPACAPRRPSRTRSRSRCRRDPDAARR